MDTRNLKRAPVAGAVLALLVAMTNCQLGRVEQGRAIAYDPSHGIVTLILDSNPGGTPRYDRLPPVQVRIPQDPSETGPAPVTGKLLSLETSPCQVRFYVEVKGSIETTECEVVEVIEGVPASDPRVVSLPRRDEARKTVTLYAPDRQAIVTLSVPEAYLSLPEETWRFGDEIRYYFKQPDQALRMMNVTQTRMS